MIVSDNAGIVHLLSHTVFVGWPEVGDVCINGFGEHDDLYTFDFTIQQARQLATELRDAANRCEQLVQEYIRSQEMESLTPNKEDIP